VYLYGIFCTQIKYTTTDHVLITEDWNNKDGHCCLNRFNMVLLVLIHIM